MRTKTEKWNWNGKELDRLFILHTSQLSNRQLYEQERSGKRGAYHCYIPVFQNWNERNPIVFGAARGSRFAITLLLYSENYSDWDTHPEKKSGSYIFRKQMVYTGLRLVEREWTWAMAARCGADVPSGSFTRFTPRSILMRMNFRPCDTISSRSGPHRSAICDMTLFFLSLPFLFVVEIESICSKPIHQ